MKFVLRYPIFTIFLISIGLLVFSFPPYASTQDIESFTYTIVDIQYDIQGEVLEAALLDKLRLQKDISFDSLDALTSYIANKKIELLNLRQLTDMSTILFTHEWNEEENRYDVIVYVYVTIGNNVLILPYFQYSSSNGLTVSARGRDYNFLGSLERFYFNFDYDVKPDATQDISAYSEQEFVFSIGMQYPLQYKKNLFKIIIEDSLSFNLYTATLAHILTLGSIYTRPLTDRLTLYADVYQLFFSNVKWSEYSQNADVAAYTYAQNRIGTGIDVQLNKTTLPFFANIFYSPSVRYSLTYPMDGRDVKAADYDTRLNHTFSINHGINFGQRKWLPSSFFRTGFTLSLDNTYTYNLKDETYKIDASIEAIQQLSFANIVGINMRLFSIYSSFIFPPENEKNAFGNVIQIDFDNAGNKLGSRMRGVIDDEMNNSAWGAVLNVEVLFKLFRINPLFEFHLGALLDIGLQQRVVSSGTHIAEWNSDEDVKIGAGVEGLAHTLFANSIVLRMSYAVNVSKILQEESIGLLDFWTHKEIFLGLSLFY